MVVGSRSVRVIGQKAAPRRSASAVASNGNLDDTDQELLELADGTTTLVTMGILLGLSEPELLVRIDRLSRLGLLDEVVDLICTREWATDTLVDADPPAFDDE